VSVGLKLTGVKTLRTQVLLKFKPVLTKTSAVSGLTKKTESVVLPTSTRTAAQLRVQFRVTSPDGRTLFGTTILHLTG
jgi:hypothetical protein